MNNRKYKSDVFSMLMEIPEYALEVYNVLNGSHYEDPAEVQIMKLEKGVLLSIQNDASFILDSYLNLYEHQSTYNPNMPLRFLIYFSNMMVDIIKEQKYDLFGTRQIPIPTPKFVVFYNGLEERPEREVMHLSDAYESVEGEAFRLGESAGRFFPENVCADMSESVNESAGEEPYGLELTCTVYNINPGYNKDIQGASRVLSGYTAFVEKVRSYTEKEPTLEDAVERAVNECIREGILAEFFTEHHVEVVKMAVLDCTFEQREELIRRDSLEEGREEGREEGKMIGEVIGEKLTLIYQICRKLNKDKTTEIIAEELETDVSLVEAICEAAKPFAPEYDERKIYDTLQNKMNG